MATSRACTVTRASGTAPAIEKETIPMTRIKVWLLALVALAGIAGVTILLLALLTNIFERKQEAR